MQLNNLPCRSDEIAEIVNGTLIGSNVTVDSIETDTRINDLKKSCFIALNGKLHKGSDYVNDAVSKGAELIISSEKINEKVTTIYVNDTKKSLCALGKYNKKNTKIIGVTGSTGKTTTKEMIISILKEKYKVSGTYSNQNNEIGVAKTLLSITDEEYCVIEMGMRKKGEIEYLASVTEPYLSVITNCGSAHLEFFNSKEEIFEAKAEILKHTQNYAIVPKEERFERLNYGKVEPIFVGNNGDYFVSGIRKKGEKIYFNVYNKKDLIVENICIKSLYLHNVDNALKAIAASLKLGVDPETVKKGIEKYKKCLLREESVMYNGSEIIVDCYNACFESMKGAIESFSIHAKSKKKMAIILLGDMLELGNDSEKYHCEIGRWAKKCGINKLYSVGKLSKGYGKGFENAELFESYDELANRLKEELSSKCMLLIKASRELALERILDKLRE